MFEKSLRILGNFSHINLNYCQSKFNKIVNNTLRTFLIERCLRLSELIIHWTDDRAYIEEADLVSYHSAQLISKTLPRLIQDDNQQQYSMVYTLESEVNSMFGNNWHKIDFQMWYNLERSYPEPATYFDIRVYLDYLFTPIKVPFSEKRNKAPIVWIISNW